MDRQILSAAFSIFTVWMGAYLSLLTPWVGVPVMLWGFGRMVLAVVRPR